MKILFASTCFPHAADPTRATYNLSLCQALTSLRTGDEAHEVAVMAPRMWQDKLKKRGGRSLDLSGLKTVEYPTFWYVPKRARRQLASWLEWSGRPALRKLTKDWTPDIVLSYWADPDGTAALRWARRVGAKFAVIVGGSDVLLLPHRGDVDGLIEQTLREADLVHTVSDQLLNAVHELTPDVKHAETTRQGIDDTRFYHGDQTTARERVGLATDKPLLLWVGRVDPVKNLRLLLDAFTRLPNDIELALVGDGPDRGLIQAKLDEHGLHDRVHVIGAVPPTSLGDWYRAADATVLSSHSEGLPNVLRESLACGRPFASVDVGGIREIGDDICRILCPPNDGHALADAMTAVLDPVYREAAIAYPVRTWRDAAVDFEAAFERLLNSDTPVARSQSSTPQLTTEPAPFSRG